MKKPLLISFLFFFPVFSNWRADAAFAASDLIIDSINVATKLTPTQIVKNTTMQLAIRVVPYGIYSTDAMPIANLRTIKVFVSFDAGQVFSTFKFIDSQGKKKIFTNNITGCYSLGLQYAYKNGIFIPIYLGMNKAGASMIYNGMKVNWNIQYVNADIGIGYMTNKRKFTLKIEGKVIKPYFSISPYFGYMLKGSQTIGPDAYDIKQNKSMKIIDFGLNFSSGLKIALSKYFAIYAEYKYIFGLQNIELSSVQKTYNRAYSFNLGVAILFYSQ